MNTPYGRALGAAAIMAIVVAIVVMAFSWPSVTSDPKNLPIAVSGPNDRVSQVETAIAENADGAIDGSATFPTSRTQTRCSPGWYWSGGRSPASSSP